MIQRAPFLSERIHRCDGEPEFALRQFAHTKHTGDGFRIARGGELYARLIYAFELDTVSANFGDSIL